ncbi:MAG: aspartate aminotransferase family protein [Candidatus Omnitrophica bacterium]|nr:aspartate aminotransferase family protein [Candidatus Omnitrophota bacterium]
MKTQDVQNLYKEYILPTYKYLPVVLVKGKGSRVWDIEGKEYLDFFPGWAVSGLGHCHPKVVSAIKEQIKKIIHISNNYLNLRQAQLAREISNHSFPARVFFSNSGAEANEGAIKFARKYGSESGRYEIITMEGSFHGRTLAAITATAQPKYQKGFEPLPEGFKYVPFNDPEALRRAVSDKTIAILLEPIQGEGGINVARPDFLKGVRALCDEKDLLLILDEVQSGIGRTGKMFAYQHYGLEPDLMTLAKSLGGGVPIAALVVNNKIKREVLTAGTHASTYGGNPLVAAAGLAVFKAIREERLLQKAVSMGEYLVAKLKELKEKFQVIKEIRGLGLMIGVQLSVPGTAVVDEARSMGLLINCTQDTVLRIMPAMTVTRKEIDKAVKILENAMEKAK